jgi:transcriptional regulator with XRE-family HTH domain
MVTGEQIRNARWRNGKMTQGELAGLMGVGLRTVNGWENGATIPPAKQAQLAEVLGLGVEVAAQVKAHIDPLAELTDSQLIAELARRLGELRTYAVIAEAARAATVTTSDQGGALPAGSRGPELPGSRLRNDVVSSGAGIPTDIPAESPIPTDIGGSRLRNKPARNVTKGRRSVNSEAALAGRENDGGHSAAAQMSETTGPPDGVRPVVDDGVVGSLEDAGDAVAGPSLVANKGGRSGRRHGQGA